MRHDGFDFEAARRALDKMGIKCYADVNTASEEEIAVVRPAKRSHTNERQNKLTKLFSKWQTLGEGDFNPDNKTAIYDVFAISITLGFVDRVNGKHRRHVWHGVTDIPKINNIHSEFTTRKDLPKHLLYLLQNQSVVDTRNFDFPNSARNTVPLTFAILLALGLIKALKRGRYVLA